MNKEAYYFSHDANARHDDKILELRAEFGWEGYGLFWAVVETLRDCSNYSYPSNAKAGLALSLNIEKPKLEQFLKHSIKLGLFVEKDGVIYSESLMKRMEEVDEKRRKRAEAGRLGGKAKAQAKQSPSNAKAKPSKEKKEKESKVNNLSSVFDSFRIKYNGSKRGLATEYQNFQKKHKDWQEVLPKLEPLLEALTEKRNSDAKKGLFVPDWPNLSTFINNRRWEEAESLAPSQTSTRKIIGYVPTFCQDAYHKGQLVILSKRPIYEGDALPVTFHSLEQIAQIEKDQQGYDNTATN